MTTLHLADRDTVADLSTYISRARALDGDGAVRLQGAGMTLAAWVGVLRGRGVMGEGTVLGLRTLGLAGPAEVDEVVPLAAVGDRLARMTDEGSSEMEMPPMTVRASWAAVSPPRSGWHPVAQIDMAVLSRTADEGIAEIAAGAPTGSGAAAVDDLRHRVWGRPLPLESTADVLPCGVAFGAYALGFLRGEHAQVLAAGRWFRVTTTAGHLLVR